MPADSTKLSNIYSKQERSLFYKLKSPERIQDFLDELEINFELNGETCLSPRSVIEQGRAHCMEAAMFAAAVFQFSGSKPLLLDLRAAKDDYDHVVALFRYRKFWGAISKTNHAVLRYREPVYETVRELALSYFHEYIDNETRKKNLREYSLPFDISRFDNRYWQIADHDIFYVPEALDESKHLNMLPAGFRLRKADGVEVEAGKLEEWLVRRGKVIKNLF